MAEVKYKDSGIEWIGEIPRDWDLDNQVSVLGEIYSGGTPAVSNPCHYTKNKEEGRLFTTISDMTSNGTYITDTKKYVTNEGMLDKKLKLVSDGTLLCSIYASVGKIAIVKNPTTISQAMLALRTNNKMDMGYYYYLLLAENKWLNILARGATQKNVSLDIFSRIKVPIPPLPTQQAIANYLDRTIPNIDRQIELSKKQADEYRELKKSEIYECVTKGLPNDRAGRVYKGSGIEWIGKIPKDWLLDKVYKLYTYKGYGFTPPTELNWMYLDNENGEDWVTISDLSDNKTMPETTKRKISKEYLKQYHRKKVPVGSLLYSYKLSTGKVAITDRGVYTNEAIIAFEPTNPCLGYLKYSSSLIEENAIRNIYSAKLLNRKIINNAYLPFPPLPEQQKIAEYLDQKCTIYDKLIGAFEKRVEQLKELKKSLIYECVTGKKQID